MHGRGRSARGIARDLGLARDTVLRYLNSPEAMLPKPRPPRGSRLDPYTEHIDRRLAEGLENCVVLLREPRARRYRGSYTILVEYVRPRRRGRQPEATIRFETAPGEQAQVDWGSLPYVGEDGEATPRPGVRDDHGLVQGLLRGAGSEGGHRRLHPVPCQCFRVPGRRSPPLPVRQRQGGDPGQGRGWPGGMEPADAGLRPAGGL